jgi:hypothetical protein
MKAAPVDYVRVCSVHGAGFWYIPGTDSCIKISGRVRAEFGYATPRSSLTSPLLGGLPTVITTPANDVTGTGTYVATGTFIPGRNRDATGFEANGRLNIDVRTSTEWGTLRAFFRYDFYRDSGPYAGGLGYANTSTPDLDNAYVQWAGLTAGKLASTFDFYANDINFQSIAGSDHTAMQFRYTATFGAGFAASIAIEDPTLAKTALYALSPLTANLNPENPLPGTFALPYPSLSPVSYGGTRVPDIVGSLRFEQGWGAAQLSAALHQSRFASGTLFPYGPAPGFGGFLLPPDGGFGNEAYADSKWGWAVQAGVKLNVPMLAAGDALYLQAAYANGAGIYLGLNNVPVSLGYSVGVAADQFAVPVYGVTADGVPYYTGRSTVKSQSGYALTAAFLHYWTPTIRQAVFGSYLRLNNPSGSSYYQDLGCTTAYCTSSFGLNDTSVWQVGTNVIWSPVTGLDIGAEVGYARVDNGRQPYAVYGTYETAAETAVLVPTTASYLTKSSDDRFYARLRVQREF